MPPLFTHRFMISRSWLRTSSTMPRRLSHNLSMMRAVKRMFISSLPIWSRTLMYSLLRWPCSAKARFIFSYRR